MKTEKAVANALQYLDTVSGGTIVITGYFPPDLYDLVTGGTQGTGDTPFLPDITITD